jgi:hypothetical protein
MAQQAPPISREACHWALARDRALYPALGEDAAETAYAWDGAMLRPLPATRGTDSAEPPLDGDHVWAWHQRCPHFSAVWVAPGTRPTPFDPADVRGVCVTVALNARGWAALAAGALDEVDFVPRHRRDTDDATRWLYDPARDAHQGLALHVYHMEALRPAAPPLFSQTCYQHLGAAWRALGAPPLLGLSGLAVSEAGDRVAARLGYREGVYRSPLHIATWAGTLPRRRTLTVQYEGPSRRGQGDRPRLEAQLRAATGAAHVQAAKLTLLTPDMPSLVWAADWFGPPRILVRARV